MSAVGSILTNVGALQALNSIATTSNTNNTLESQLSSGLAINSPADNPAGYITAQGFTSQLNGLTQAISNANTGVSLLQTAQGAITQQIGVVQQLNSIAVQAANGTQTSAEAQSLQNVVTQLTSQVNTIANQTQFNNISLLNGTFSGVQFQVGANEGQTQTLSIGNLAASAIGLNATAA
ncbi:MAG: flagellin, partial [Rhodospirillales bacterium 20-64-7]